MNQTIKSAVRHIAALFLTGLIASTAWAQNIAVEGAWARATVPAQKSSGAYMVIKSDKPLRLVGFSTQVAGVAELHEMAMMGNVMHMRAVEALEVLPGKPVELKPGGYHLMLMDLKQQLKEGSKIPVTLRFTAADKKVVEQQVMVDIRK